MRNKEVLYNGGKPSKHHNFMDSENELTHFFYIQNRSNEYE